MKLTPPHPALSGFALALVVMPGIPDNVGTPPIVAAGNYTLTARAFHNLGAKNNSAPLSITVLSGQPLPFATRVASGPDSILVGTGGTPGGKNRVLKSTDLTLPLTNWTQVGSGTFDGSGDFFVSLTVNAAEPQQFYTVAVPSWINKILD